MSEKMITLDNLETLVNNIEAKIDESAESKLDREDGIKIFFGTEPTDSNTQGAVGGDMFFAGHIGENRQWIFKNLYICGEYYGRKTWNKIAKGDLDNYYTKTETNNLLATKQDTTTITTNTTDTDIILTVADNNEYRYTQELDSIDLTMPNGDFIASIVFTSGSTATLMTYDSGIKWSGDDVVMGFFVPTADKTYNIVLWYDGINVNGIARGV